MKIFNGTHKTIMVVSGKKSTLIPANYTIGVRLPKGSIFNTSDFYVSGEGDYYTIVNKTPLQDIGIYIKYSCSYCGKEISDNKLKRGNDCYCSDCFIKDNVEN